MANPVVAPWELDPKGDVLLTLHNPNAPFAVWDEYWYRKIATEATHVRPIYKSNAKVQFLLSSRHLSLASGYFKNLLRGPWIEATPTSPDGRLCVDAEGWDENSMLILMRIIHGHNYKIPKSMTLEEVAKVAVLVDYYQCHEAVMVWSDVWINNMPGYDKHTFNRDIVLWILVTQVFRKEKLFKNATLVAIQHCKGKFPTLGLPITAAAGRIDEQREYLLGQIFFLLYDLLKRLREGRAGCSFECSSMLLGALSIQLQKLGILEPPLNPPYARYSYLITISTMLGLVTPRWIPLPSSALPKAPASTSREEPHSCTLPSFLSARLSDKAKGIELANIRKD